MRVTCIAGVEVRWLPGSVICGVPVNADKQADHMIDKGLGTLRYKWLPRIVKVVALLLVCCCFGILKVLLQ